MGHTTEAEMMRDCPRWRPTRSAMWALMVGAFVTFGAGCSANALGGGDLPSDVSDPAITETPTGARNAYNGTVAQFAAAFAETGVTSSGRAIGSSAVVLTGLLTDELHFGRCPITSICNGDDNPIDHRLLDGSQDENVAALYGSLQRVRGQASQAIGLLERYLPDQPVLRAHLYALQAYAEVFLAETFCSGVPLSTLDYAGDFTYRPGSSTAGVFTHAVVLFDTALALAGNDERIIDLARIGKGRALLALGDTAYAAAAADVALVPDSYQYAVNYTTADSLTLNGRHFGFGFGFVLTVPDNEGANGLHYAEDPRTAVVRDSIWTSSEHRIYYRSAKYDTAGAGPVVLASGIEARLIEAEAALNAGDISTWLGKLNMLREAAGLSDTTDPGAPSAQVDLMFSERAFWLFLTGHRQGDLRRLIRQYGRLQSQVYPVGVYPNATTVPVYGSSVTFPIPASELPNPLFTGCFSTGA